MARPRMPKELHELSGTVSKHPERKQYGSSKGISFPKGTAIPAPKRFSNKTKEAWNRVVPTLVGMQILTSLDLPKLDAMFSFYDTFVKVDAQVNEMQKEDIYRDPDMLDHFRTLTKIRSENWNSFTREASLFGLSPSERAKLQIPDEQEEADELQKLLGV